MAKLDNLSLENITMDKLNGNYVEFKRLSGSGQVYYPYYSQDYNHVFKIEDGKAYDYSMNTKTGQLEQDPKPVVALQDINVTDKNGKPATVPGVVYAAKRYVDNPYELYPDVQQSAIIGEPAVAFVQALSYYLESLQFFSYDSYDNTVVKILGSLYDEDGSSSTSTTTSTTTVAPVAPSTTTTTSTTTKN